MSDIRIVAELEVKPEHVKDLMPVLKELVEKSRTEAANNGYDLTVDLDNPGHFFVIERWASLEGIETHNATAHFQAFAAAIQNKALKLNITKLKNAL